MLPWNKQVCSQMTFYLFLENYYLQILLGYMIHSVEKKQNLKAKFKSIWKDLCQINQSKNQLNISSGVLNAHEQKAKKLHSRLIILYTIAFERTIIDVCNER